MVLFQKLGIEGWRISMTGLTQSKTVVGWGLNWKLKVSRSYGCLILYGGLEPNWFMIVKGP